MIWSKKKQQKNNAWSQYLYLNIYLGWAEVELLNLQDSFFSHCVLHHHCKIHNAISSHSRLVLRQRDGVTHCQRCRGAGKDMTAVLNNKIRSNGHTSVQSILHSRGWRYSSLYVFQKLSFGLLLYSLTWALTCSIRALGLVVVFLTITHSRMLSPTVGFPSILMDTSRLDAASTGDKGRQNTLGLNFSTDW